MIVVNFFGAPGSGKTTAAMRFAGHLKSLQRNAEYVSEFAKDQVWAKSDHMLLNQNWIFANQELKLRQMKGQVDILATDSPLPLSVFYAPEDYPPSFEELCFHFFDQYKNVNIFLRRSHEYSAVGRLQDEREAEGMERRMRAFLLNTGVKFLEISAADAAPEQLFALLCASGDLAP